MKYRRAKVAGGTYFFTVVTHNRRPFLCEPENIDLLRNAFRYVKHSHPFIIDAIAILPEHIHCLWTLPPADDDFSTRWRLLKSYFTRHCQEQYNSAISASRFDKREQAIWQRRFWEHQIQDERDFSQHFDYIHYNPVKHNLVRSPNDWQFSSFHHHVQQGVYSLDWGSSRPEIG
jgi:putative transposase